MTNTTTKTTDPTAAKLAEMLQENTGRALCDSGDYYGRNWEMNQGVDFEKTQEGTLRFWNRNGELDIMPIISVYHFLKERLEYNEALDEQYREFCEREDTYRELRSAEVFVEQLDDARGIYGDESGPFTVNTYNGEDLLSQIIQYVYWTDDDGAHVMLQIHGGCDARGGYTDPVAFDVVDYDGTAIFDNARASIYCNDCGKYWDTDDGYHWHTDGCSGRDDLKDYPATDERPNYPAPIDPAQLSLPIDLPERPQPNVGVIWVDDDENGHCPCCGGILRAAPWPCG
ncbi:MAG: hypothetical protein DWQ31_17135 [Planctomycetota bacterium]|nr:MAG: hypothetical protein DWQ31_17135 [Planctomycetota bacterium]REJ92079.1 MAG: hypothetical protein DWQ35_13085 [Planctomycetota bacterium]REK28615.1 MAG: hypothetical protein DWQ42_04675 [Planctomycetota bacterium]REK39229.1 MAG: hypothetical protein DWQ46_18255 [Planctomycetota bacterium]